MDTILIEINDSKAYKLLRDLENMNLIKLVQKKEKSAQKLSDKYRGSISGKTAEKLLEQVKKNREEWREFDK